MNGIKGGVVVEECGWVGVGGRGGSFYSFIVRCCRWRRALSDGGGRHVTGGGAGCPLVAQNGDHNDVSRIPPA